MKHTLTVNRQVNVTKICLTGALRSGKDTVADILRAYYDFSRFAFGDNLKVLAHRTFPWVDRESKPRKLYQDFGQLMRQIDPDVWVKHTEKAIESHIEMESSMFNATDIGVVITDLRQPNEYEWARENGYTIIRVKAQSALRIARAQQAGDDFSLEDLTHSTEAHSGHFDVQYEVVNDGSIEELKRQIDAIMAQINAVK